jgi:hypothetical protein
VYLLTQLRTGHNWLSTYAKTFGFRDNDQCVCGAQETVTHVRSSPAPGCYCIVSGTLDSGPRMAILARCLSPSNYRWPIVVPLSVLQYIDPKVQESRFIRLFDENEQGSPLASVYHREDFIGIQSQDEMQLTTRYLNIESPTQMNDVYQAVVADADRLASAQNLLGLRIDNSDELFSHRVEVRVGLVENEQPKGAFAGSGSDDVYEDQNIYISLRNDGATTAHVNILNINVQGKISLISKSSVTGIELPPQRWHWIRKSPLGALKGLRVSWPADMSRTHSVDEHLLLFISSSPVDLRAIADPHLNPQRTAVSQLQRKLYQLCRGELRGLMDDDEADQNAYDIVHIPFTILPREQHRAVQSLCQTRHHESQHSSTRSHDHGDELSIPSVLTEGQDLPELPPHLRSEPRVSIPSLTWQLIFSQPPQNHLLTYKPLEIYEPLYPLP